jgi:hypothetical protein
MNERIRQLVDKIWAEEYWDNPNTDKLLPAQLDKFAQLIIRDCMDVVDGYTKARTFDTHYDAVAQIETLFGIKHDGDGE